MENPLVEAMVAAAKKELPAAADMVTKLGTIDPAYTSGRPRVLLDGDASLTGITQTYAYVNTYKPVASHRVLLVKSGDTWVILGNPDEVGQGIVIPQYPNRTDGVGRYYTNSTVLAAPTITNFNPGSPGTVYYLPIYCSAPVKIDRVAINISSAAAGGSSATFGRYTNSSSGTPGTLAATYANVTTNVTGPRESTVSDTIPGGISWLAIVFTTSVPQITGHAPTAQYALGGQSSVAVAGQLSHYTQSSATLPATAGSLTEVVNANCPAVWWRVSA